MAGYIDGKEVFDIPLFEGRYAVTREGEIYSYPKNRGLSSKGIWLKINKSGKLYPRVRLVKDGKYFDRNVHRILAEVFIPNPEEKAEVNHINGDKQDYRIENLEWVSISENIQHAWNTGLITITEGLRESGRKQIKAHNLKKRRFTKEQVLEIRKLRKSGIIWRELSEMFGVTMESIRDICEFRSYKEIA